MPRRLQGASRASERWGAALGIVDGGAVFKEEWRQRRRHQQDGAMWEKAGVNVSVVYGVMPPEAYRAAKGEPSAANPSAKAGPVLFFAAVISSDNVSAWIFIVPSLGILIHLT
ncbi:oxygen-dependent coproporphyrinogen-III oxidase, chloroplastic-like isoform X10 [Ananas comosus]|uniref:Oxygen-dependent coproporphyrinogen-III oxidase, chloroplastic-like isoform X10 n=1 Tax=Ananas comosus TaxID=4615 RepID=A0A6P5FDX6_ANACO|nr:oxygen-dependent coproporphyrinogen-III oxidase, chloroplastic-like isoform X10 [Ananas comosus]